MAFSFTGFVAVRLFGERWIEFPFLVVTGTETRMSAVCVSAALLILHHEHAYYTEATD